MSDLEKKCALVNDMIRTRIKTCGETEAEAVQWILARVANQPDDAPMLVTPGGDAVDAHTIRVWASLYCTPKTTQ